LRNGEFDAMNKQKASPMGEATLWHLYRRLLSAQMLDQRLAGQGGRAGREAGGAAIAAALTENLIEGDTLGIAAGDLTTRYLCGVPLAALREAAEPRRGRPKSQALKNGGWPLAVDAEHALLPGKGPGASEEQAGFAIGTALAARLHHTQGIAVLLDRRLPAARKPGQRNPWDEAARTAVALQLPLLLIGGSPAAGVAPPGPKKQPAPLPSIPVDREDTLALYRVIYESAARARSGGGPTWIECGRWAVEGTARGATPATPLERMEEALRSRHFFHRRQQRSLQQALEKEFAQAGWS
jgi:TPP-dependent pyruvate/acetoin dehydrogenase alpha subunit